MGESVRRSSLPAGLIVGAVMTASTLVISILGLVASPEAFARWYVMQEAGLVAGTALMCVGALELARRLPRRSAVAAQIAALGFGAVAVTRVIVAAANYTVTSDELLVRIAEQGMYADCFALVVASAALAVAAGWGRNVPVLVAVVGAALLVCAPPPLHEELVAMLSTRGLSWALVIPDVIWAALVVVLTRRAAASAAEPPEDQRSAIVGFKRAAVALWIQLGTATLLVTVASADLARLVPYVRFVHVAAGAIAMVLFASGLIRVARASGTALPGVRLAAAAFLTVWAAGAQTMFALSVYTSLSTSHAWGSVPAAWPLLTPIVAAAGIFVLLWAIRQLAVSSGDDKLHRAASSTLTVYPILMGLSIALLTAVDSRTWGQIVLSLSTTLTVGGCVLAASLCGKAAQSIEARPALATATLRETEGV